MAAGAQAAGGDEVYLDGAFLPRKEARVSVEDRGFLLGDGVYEVSPAYRGRFFRLDRHMTRLRKGLEALKIDFDPSRLPEVHQELLERNGLSRGRPSVVYVQLTRGVAPRTHHFPEEPVSPTVYGYAKAHDRTPRSRWEEGWGAVTVPDQRWSRADVKTIALLPNVLAQEAARRAGVPDALMVRDGLALEGGHSNLFVVFGEALVTHPASNQILHGVTRECVLELARAEGLRVEERPIPLGELEDATELFFTGTTTEVRPTVELDGRSVGDGRVGPVTRTLYRRFLEQVDEECGGGGWEEWGSP